MQLNEAEKVENEMATDTPFITALLKAAGMKEDSYYNLVKAILDRNRNYCEKVGEILGKQQKMLDDLAKASNSAETDDILILDADQLNF